MTVSESFPRDRETLRRATERLLAWGFSPRAIAQELGCSPSWVYAVRREHELTGSQPPGDLLSGLER